MCRIFAADSRFVIINEEEREENATERKKNEIHTGNIIRSYKELSSWHYLRKDNRSKLPSISNTHFTDCLFFLLITR